MSKLEIKIDRPCSEKWDSFEKRGLNGYCGSCQKVVVDFTKMSDREIKEYFLKMKGADVCGRMRGNQQKVYTTSKSKSWKPLASTLLAGVALFFTGHTATAQRQKDKKEVALFERKATPKEIWDKTVTGKVTDENGEALPGVNVVIKGTTFGTQTDLDGMYSIKINRGNALMFSFVGFETTEVEIGARNVIDMTLGVSDAVLGGVVYVGGVSSKWYTPRGMWGRIKGFFGRIF